MHSKIKYLISVVAFFVLLFSIAFVNFVSSRPQRGNDSVPQIPLQTHQVPVTDKKEVFINNSSSYYFHYNDPSKQVLISLNGDEILNFTIPEKPLAAWIYKPTNVLAVITSSDGRINSSHNLYVVKNNSATKVFSGQVSYEEEFSDLLYSYWGD